MAAEVSSTVGYMSGFNKEEGKHVRGGGGEKPTALVTRDLLGGLHEIESRELDLDLQVPAGWEKRLDLKVRPLFSLNHWLIFVGTTRAATLGIERSLEFCNFLAVLTSRYVRVEASCSMPVMFCETEQTRGFATLAF